MVVAEGLCGDTEITAEGHHYAVVCTIETEVLGTPGQFRDGTPEESPTEGQRREEGS